MRIKHTVGVKAISDPRSKSIRLRDELDAAILAALKDGPKTKPEIRQTLGEALHVVTKHMTRLRRQKKVKLLLTTYACKQWALPSYVAQPIPKRPGAQAPTHVAVTKASRLRQQLERPISAVIVIDKERLSWWCRAERERFSWLAEQHRERMNTSKVSVYVNPVMREQWL